MKKIILIGNFLLLIVALNAQVTFDKRYEYSTSIVKLETQGYKYFLMDVPGSQCRIYNLDHSLYKTINCAVPSTSHYLADIKFISEKLFDSDAGIELAFTYYKYVTTETSYYYEYGSKIINEDGSALQTIDGARYLYINATGENTDKLFAYCYDYSIFPEKVWTNIYSLPGTIVSAQLLNEKSPDILLNAFPNPASNSIKVAYSLPENVNQATLHLIDNSGRQVEQFIVDNHTDHLMLDVSRFQSGVYVYFIEYGNTKSPAKKLVVR